MNMKNLRILEEGVGEPVCLLPEEISRNEEPSDEELRILRDEVDKDRLYI